MEALSPRSANLKVRMPNVGPTVGKTSAETKMEVKKPVKEHALPPPTEVMEPPMEGGLHSTTYRSGKLLGKGGFAVCYEGRNTKSGQVFALKVVKSKMSVPRVAEKFRTELQIHAKMHHPHIVNFFRAFTYQESTYVVLELCDNGSVMDMVKGRKCISLPEVRRLTVQLCGAVKYMHRRNVIHRDLKMGNLFLDSQMNIKVGDFGLAAITIDEKEARKYRKLEKLRRTTMCGTPNYIAPEILEKQKVGHGHKVDIWAIGVICFAMLTGFPPFQSTSQEEIYRKVKSLEYVWPKELDGSTNYIPKEAKELVSLCLSLDPEDRPEPDDIVEHAFFKMYPRCIPKSLDSTCRTNKPIWLNQRDPRGDSMEPIFGLDAEATRNFYSKCGVGRDVQGNIFPCVGEKADKTASLECLEEEYLGRNPVVPIPESAIYSPDYTLDSHGNMVPLWGISRGTIIEDDTESTLASSQTTSTTSNDSSTTSELPVRFISARPPPPQSHAATLRQQARPQRPLAPVADERRTISTTSNSRNVKLASEASVVSQPPTGLLSRPSVRSSSRIASSGSLRQNTRPDAPKLLRSQTTGDVKQESFRRQRIVQPGETKQAAGLEESTKPKIEPLITVREIQAEKPVKGSSSETFREKRHSPYHETNSTLDPNEPITTLPKSNPCDILAQLKTLLSNLKVGAKDPERSRSRRPKADNPNHAVVSKWVDYANKFGIGYILSDGTVGCLFKATSTLPCSTVVVRGAEEHLRKKRLPYYAERHQLVPQSGSGIEFFENGGLSGTLFATVSPSMFNVDQKPDHTVTSSPFYQEKLKRISLWDKFGRYMTASMGKDEDEKLIAEAEKRPIPKETLFVKFYQRCGNVGIWVFRDGSFQFNFPDHTKMIIAHDGAWIDFVYLQVEDMAYMEQKSTVKPGTLERRDSVGMPTAGLKFHDGNKRSPLEEMLRVNRFGVKMNWVQDIIGRYVENGGLGELRPRTPLSSTNDHRGFDGRVLWSGVRELTPPAKGKERTRSATAAARGNKENGESWWQEKLVWVTVGKPIGEDDEYESKIRKVKGPAS